MFLFFSKTKKFISCATPKEAKLGEIKKRVQDQIAIVLKTGPDRTVLPVQPGTGFQSGPIMEENRK